MTKKITIELTAHEHDILCFILDNGWDYLADNDYLFEPDYYRDEVLAVMRKVTSSK